MGEGRLPRAIISAAVVALLFVPVVLDRDSFPLSTHPMYATAREPVERLPSVVGVDAAGEIRRLSLGLIASTDDPLVAQARVRNAIRSGRAEDLCRTVAERVAEDDSRAELVAVVVRTERLDLTAFVADDALPLGVEVHAECEVRR